MSNKKINIIVPCYNEGEVVIQFYKALTKQLESINDYEYSIFFIDDGSSDNTLKIIQQVALSDKRVRYISFSRNFGKESAMIAALEHVDGDCAIIMDADLQHPPELIPRMIEKYEQGNDQVIGRRTRTGDPPVKTLCARMYYKLVNKVMDVDIKDGAGDYRLISRPVIDALISLKESNRFSKGLFSWVGFDQVYIEYENEARAAGETKWSFKKLLNYGIDGMLSFNAQPLKICMIIGVVFIAMSIAYLAFLLMRIMVSGVDLPGYFTTIAITCMLGGIQLISIGIIGEYVGKIYQETKRRPSYIIQKTNLDSSTNTLNFVKRSDVNNG